MENYKVWKFYHESSRKEELSFTAVYHQRAIEIHLQFSCPFLQGHIIEY